MPSLGQSSYCDICGRPYRTSDGHNCPGPRRALTPETKMARHGDYSAGRARNPHPLHRIGAPS